MSMKCAYQIVSNNTNTVLIPVSVNVHDFSNGGGWLELSVAGCRILELTVSGRLRASPLSPLEESRLVKLGLNIDSLTHTISMD